MQTGNNPLAHLSEPIGLDSFFQLEQRLFNSVQNGPPVQWRPILPSESPEVILVLCALVLVCKESKTQFHVLEAGPYLDFSKLRDTDLALHMLLLQGQMHICSSLKRCIQQTTEANIDALVESIHLGKLNTLFRQELFDPVLDPIKFHEILKQHRDKLLSFYSMQRKKYGILG